MNHKLVYPLFLFTLALALYLVPAVAAQEEESGNMLTDGLSGIWATLSDYGSQASEYVTSHVPEVAAIGTTGGIATGLGAAYKSASSAKNKLQVAFSNLSTQSAEAQAQAQTQLNNYKTEAETKLSTAKTQMETLTQQATDAQNNASTLEEKLKQQIYQNEQLQQLYHSKVANNVIVKEVVR